MDKPWPKKFVFEKTYGIPTIPRRVANILTSEKKVNVASDQLNGARFTIKNKKELSEKFKEKVSTHYKQVVSSLNKILTMWRNFN